MSRNIGPKEEGMAKQRRGKQRGQKHVKIHWPNRGGENKGGKSMSKFIGQKEEGKTKGAKECQNSLAKKRRGKLKNKNYQNSLAKKRRGKLKCKILSKNIDQR
jgi:hypothetical protein